jgi:hypothetical protein
MLTTLLIIVLILWLLGFAGGATFGGLLHLLLVVALVLFIVDLLGRRGGPSV